MAHLTQLFHDLILHFGYAGLFLVVLLGNLGVPAGLEIIMPAAGGLAAQGHLPALGGVPGWVVVGTVATAAEILGTGILYAIGWYGGVPFVRRYGKYVHLSEAELNRVHAFYERYGTATVFWCRFVPFVRGVGSLPAGVSRMQKRYFVTYTALGSALFCFGLAFVGNVAGHNLDAILATLHKLALLIVGLALIAIVAGILLWRARAKKAAATDLAA